MRSVYKFTAQVKKGYGRGKGLGFPTLNFGVPTGLSKYDEGIYASKIMIEGVPYIGALYFGPLYAFGSTEQVLEVHVLDEDLQDIPVGTLLEIELYTYIRKPKDFADTNQLIAEIEHDVRRIRAVFK